ncbi:acyclic terpene utilization AtuA family protein [Frigidibacter sp.]|uniref:acyclic terpene utilization AtuA family protein n=1 Tax=Frigidibacter sp. TaxID=2586418 RepID=UPI0027344611|nr:acyclic terpene utilization AtuA family protein [Frigidibacter sp.]MDP3340593.1 acyclic terpene utilization AtuA family protein [Frigidibacter sp.]
MTAERVYIGCGAGFAGDRPDGGRAVVEDLARKSGPRFMIYETLAERTLAQAQLRRMNGGPGYLPRLDAFLRPVLETCLKSGIRIVSNFGAADPEGACRRIAALCAEMGLPQPRMVYVLGDDVMTGAARAAIDTARRETGDLVAANAYIGAASVVEALDMGAEIVVTGRVADPSLALGPLVHSFGWGWQDWDLLAAGTLCGHMLECGAQVSGGYFADPGLKDVPDLAHLGFPLAEVAEDGSFVITKPSGTGGCVTLQTVREQVLYEIDDPARYLTPDVVLDLTAVHLSEAGPDRVQVSGARGWPRPDTLRAMACHRGGWLGEAEISYAGPNALPRGRLAAGVLETRLRDLGYARTRVDLIGVNAIADQALPQQALQLPEVRLRLAVAADSAQLAQTALDEVESLYLCGPAGGGGVRRSLVERLTSEPVLIERDLVRTWAIPYPEVANA